MGDSKQKMMDEIHRISTQEYDEDGNPKTVGYDNDELVEVILDLQKKAEKDNE
mgnify:CR=1 FL=1